MTTTDRMPVVALPADLTDLVERARRGDTTAVPDIRRLLDDNPHVWRACGDLARHAEESLLQAVGRDLVVQESVRRRLAEIKREQAGSSPIPLEALLVERLALCWLEVYLAGLEAQRTHVTDPTGFFAAAAERRHSAAHWRYLQAARALATVRRVMAPRRRAKLEKSSK